MVLKGGGGANHHLGACRERTHSGNARRTADDGRGGDTARERKTQNHDDFSEFEENLRKFKKIMAITVGSVSPPRAEKRLANRHCCELSDNLNLQGSPAHLRPSPISL
jgi:hypothetical protein